MLVSSPGMTSAEHAEIKRPKQENAEGKLTAHSLLDDASTGVQILLHVAAGGKQKHKLPSAQWFVDPTDPNRWWWWDGRGWTDGYALIEPTGTVPAVRSTAPLSQPTQTSRDTEDADAYAAQLSRFHLRH